MHAVIVTAQERDCHVSKDEAERYTSPLDCTTPSSQKVMTGNLHFAADTTAVAILPVLLLLLSG